ncbi:MULTISPECIES: flagellar assembly protein FliH [unclassified Pseudoalteromonas]|uniref:flagellar assembly protein FliH n=1 Tax=unclassified Pseudoalteromonas TaxID=194690 RepID=UPI0025B5A783|nr:MULTISPECIES: flagellar assembly protein FliH [unclassified Pseudoalteromonas]MDN3378192.1 flagellar assembly protein FliH [Pseudoalteromonas sp. APC 3893]MDN3388556.1 flagellar assembly protein FliH [Pseudoalteromonas sp. APC 4017]
MNKPRSTQGRPLHANEAVDELLENWPIPDVTQDTRKYDGRSTAFGTPLAELYKKEVKEPIEEPEAEEELPNLTMAELERIRQDAYEEGLKQGHEQGYIDGFEKGVSEGKEAGYKEGVELGKTQGHEEVKPLIEEQLTGLKTLLDSLTAPLDKVDEDAEKQLIQLAVMLAEALIYQEVKTSPNVLLHSLKHAIDALGEQQQSVRIHLNPDDIELVKSSYGEQALSQSNWQLVPEPTLERGGCQVKTPQSSIDMTMKTRVKETLDSFLHSSGI